MNLQQIIYHFLMDQIKFGVYRCGDTLPSIEEGSRWFSVSLDTVRYAYQRLEQERLISLTKKIGATVVVQYDAEEIEHHIQQFYSVRRAAVVDLCRALNPMLSQVQWFSLKNASPEQLEMLEDLCTRQDIRPTQKMVREFRLIYGALNNDLLLRLIWQVFMFLQGPFFSLPQNIPASERGDAVLLHMISLCRQKDWHELWRAINDHQAQLFTAICHFCEDGAVMGPSDEPVTFSWNVYEKASQHRYTLAIEILRDIRHGLYPEGEFLPPPVRIAEARQVSVMTVRRTLGLLNQLGATQSINGIGTKVLNEEDSAKICDFSQPVLQKRLLDFAQSLQILALTCKGVAEAAWAAMDEGDIQRWKGQLAMFKESGRGESVAFASLEIISRHAPIRSAREIYEQLLRILLWGYPLRGMHGSRQAADEFYLPRIDALIRCMDQHDGAGLAVQLQDLLCYEMEVAMEHLTRQGIGRGSGLVVPEMGQLDISL